MFKQFGPRQPLVWILHEKSFKKVAKHRRKPDRPADRLVYDHVDKPIETVGKKWRLTCVELVEDARKGPDGIGDSQEQ
jgi:hypothetical protein